MNPAKHPISQMTRILDVGGSRRISCFNAVAMWRPWHSRCSRRNRRTACPKPLIDTAATPPPDVDPCHTLIQYDYSRPISHLRASSTSNALLPQQFIIPTRLAAWMLIVIEKYSNIPLVSADTARYAERKRSIATDMRVQSIPQD
jgi:hypothetical protein